MRSFQRAAGLGLALLLAGVLAASAADVAVGRRVPLQGRLAGHAGPVTVAVELFDARVGGTRLWGPELHSVVPDAEGNFQLVVGSVSPPLDLLGDGIADLDQLETDLLYAQLTVLSDGETFPLAPRQRLVPAFDASTAELALVTDAVPAASLDGAHVADGALRASDRAAEAGLAFSATPSTAVLSTTEGPFVEVAAQSLTLQAPAAGQVLVSATGSIDMDDFLQFAVVDCSVGDAPSLATERATFYLSSNQEIAAEGFTVSRRFPVSAAGASQFHFVCQTQQADGESGPPVVRAVDVVLTALFVPTRLAP